MPRTIVDPRLRASLVDHYSSRCTIQTPVYTTTNANQQVQSGAANVSGMVDIPCQIGALIEQRPTDNENRGPNIQETYVQRNCKLLGYFPDIVPRTMQAVVDGVTYAIRGVEHDSPRFSTRMRLEISTP